MATIEGQPRQRIGDHRPVTGKHLGHIARPHQLLQQLERLEVRRQVAVRIGDHRRTATQHHVAGHQPAHPIGADSSNERESLV